MGVEDHPRVCGEKQLDRNRPGWPIGSPPRMRGKGLAGVENAADVGITPAYAGKSVTDIVAKRVDRDHPRVCGEKWCSMFQYSPEMGSPPRMRGKVGNVEPVGLDDRITPAYAGKSRF